jgi:glycosyltransferase involved in cell wall biosynthesis
VTLRVGYLHVGRDRSGVRRYGRIIAAAAAARSDLEVVQSDAGDRHVSLGDLRAAARRLAGADVVHVQWKLADWDPRWGGIPRTEVVMQALGSPTVVTMHDIFDRQGIWERRLSPSAIGLRRLGHAAARLVVHCEEERGRLEGLVPMAKVAVVPHFVEVRRPLPDRDVARRSLHLPDGRVITLLGYMTKRRGHRLLIDALRELPDDVLALFVGTTIEGREHIQRELEAYAGEAGVAERVRFMGYVEEDVLESILSATDVALCPFRMMSASGALATWISAGVPIVASDLGPVRELDAMAPGALRTFAPYEPGPLAERVAETLAEARTPDARVVELGAQLATPRILEHYIEVYRAAMEG